MPWPLQKVAGTEKVLLRLCPGEWCLTWQCTRTGISAGVLEVCVHPPPKTCARWTIHTCFYICFLPLFLFPFWILPSQGIQSSVSSPISLLQYHSVTKMEKCSAENVRLTFKVCWKRWTLLSFASSLFEKSLLPCFCRDSLKTKASTKIRID